MAKHKENLEKEINEKMATKEEEARLANEQRDVLQKELDEYKNEF